MKFYITYGKGKPGTTFEAIEADEYRDAFQYAAAHAYGWGFGIMERTESKMLDYLQSLLDAMKKERLSADYNENELARETVSIMMSEFGNCADMFASVTGRHVTFKNWQVIVE